MNIQKNTLIQLGTNGTDRATGFTMSNKIVTALVDGVKKSFFAIARNDGISPFTTYQTMSTYVDVYNHNTGLVESSTLIGYNYDNHGSPALTMDNDGYFHIVYGSHNNAFRYKKSQNPLDSTVWSAEETIGTNATYPVIKVDSVGNIHLLGSGGNKTIYTRKLKNGSWENFRTLYTSTKTYSRYNCCMVIKNDAIHIIAPNLSYIAAGGDYNADMEMYYLKSTNNGETFSTPELIWQGYGEGNTLAVDEEGNPHIVIPRRAGGDDKYLYHIYHNGLVWKNDTITIINKHIWESKILIDRAGRVYIAIQTSALSGADGWSNETNEIYLAYSEGKDQYYNYSFVVNKLVDADANIVFMPTIEEEYLDNNVWVAWNVGGSQGDLTNLQQNDIYAIQLTDPDIINIKIQNRITRLPINYTVTDRNGIWVQTNKGKGKITLSDNANSETIKIKVGAETKYINRL